MLAAMSVVDWNKATRIYHTARRRLWPQEPREDLMALPEHICAFCHLSATTAQTDSKQSHSTRIHLPYESRPCMHVFCFYCVSTAKRDNVPCPRCRQQIDAISPHQPNKR
jgi:hypothetical protein